MTPEQFTITRRPAWAFTGGITVTIECDPLASQPIKLGLAVRAALKSGPDLTRANLTGANLTGASLAGVDLTWANLTGADLAGADLTGVNLTGADLTGVNLTWADLTWANLTGADLTGADLTGVNLTWATVRGEPIKRLFASVSRLNDPYVFHAFELEAGGVKILAGCRWFTVSEFCAHVADKYPDTDKATETLAILDFIEARASALKIALTPVAEITP